MVVIWATDAEPLAVDLSVKTPPAASVAVPDMVSTPLLDTAKKPEPVADIVLAPVLPKVTLLKVVPVVLLSWSACAAPPVKETVPVPAVKVKLLV